MLRLAWTAPVTYSVLTYLIISALISLWRDCKFKAMIVVMLASSSPGIIGDFSSGGCCIKLAFEALIAVTSVEMLTPVAPSKRVIEMTMRSDDESCSNNESTIACLMLMTCLCHICTGCGTQIIIWRLLTLCCPGYCWTLVSWDFTLQCHVAYMFLMKLHVRNNFTHCARQAFQCLLQRWRLTTCQGIHPSVIYSLLTPQDAIRSTAHAWLARTEAALLLNLRSCLSSFICAHTFSNITSGITYVQVASHMCN